MQILVHVNVALHRIHISLHMAFLLLYQDPFPYKTGISMKEDARDPSFFNFFLEACAEAPVWHLVVGYVATGCILILQADRV